MLRNILTNIIKFWIQSYNTVGLRARLQECMTLFLLSQGTSAAPSNFAVELICLLFGAFIWLPRLFIYFWFLQFYGVFEFCLLLIFTSILSIIVNRCTSDWLTKTKTDAKVLLSIVCHLLWLLNWVSIWEKNFNWYLIFKPCSQHKINVFL